jgi:HAD superfamily hydrolase (TIGR01509 family)
LISYAQIDTLFLDAGNTLVSIDFDWVAAEIRDRGFECDPQVLRRAEAAARPPVSRRAAERHPIESYGPFRHFYLSTILSCLEAVAAQGRAAVESLTDALAPVLWHPGEANRLWRWVIPGVPEALEAFKALGLRLAVVSNSDGTVERGLIEVGLCSYFDVVVDSTVVGFEKPDPRIFLHALTVLGADPGRVIHVGDMYHADVVGARAAGLHAILLDPFDDWEGVDCERARDLGVLAERIEDNKT